MAAIKNKNTTPELFVRRALHKLGFRFRLHRKDLPGKPDLVLPKHNAVIFVHGCFWHGHENCKDFRLPKSRTEWWEQKITRTIQRDRQNIELLKSAGWLPLTVWACQLNNDAIQKLASQLNAKSNG